MLVYLQMIESEEERSKFEQIYDKYVGLMFHIAMKYLDNRQDQEDAVQMACEAVVRNIKKISEVDCPQTYSYIVNTIESKSIDVLRGIQRRSNGEFKNIFGVNVELPEDNGLANALAKLPAHYREILLLRFDCGFTTKELAAMLGMTRGNVQKQIWRAKEVLAKFLGEEGVNIEK